MSKVFALVDCNNFYASCERVFNPKLEGKPIVILSNNDGVIISRSNEAKALGIKMGKPAFKITPLLEKHNVNIFSSNYALYGDLSQRVMNTLALISPDIEIYSIDEAFIDISDLYEKNFSEFGFHVKQTIDKWIGIPVSVGIASTKTLSKVANHYAKKHLENNGVFEMTSPDLVEKILKQTPVDEVWGVGRKYSKFLYENQIKTAFDLRNAKDSWVRKNMSVVGLRTVKELRGEPCYNLDSMPVGKKAILTSRSFGKPLEKYDDVLQATSNFVSSCAEKLRKQKSCARAITVFVMTNKFSKGPQYINGKTIKFPVASNDTSEMIHYAAIALKMIFRNGYKYKKSGVIVNDLVPEENIQTSLWDTIDREKNKKLMKSVDKLNDLMGRNKVKFAVQGLDRKWKMRQEQLSPCYTTNWNDILEIKI